MNRNFWYGDRAMQAFRPGHPQFNSFTHEGGARESAWRARVSDWHVLLWLVLALGGCDHALAQSASRYCALTQQAATQLHPIARLARQTCMSTARTEFLQQRLLRLHGETIAHPLDAKYYVDEVHWRDKAQATGQITWSAYCEQIDQTSATYRMSLEALSNYAQALGALSNTGQDLHPDWASLVASADSIQSGIRDPNTRWTKLISPMTTPIKELSHLFISKRAEASLARALAQSEPILLGLVHAMDDYLAALGEQQQTLRARQMTLIQSFELSSGFGPKSEPSRGTPCRSPSAEGDDKLAHLCEQSALQQKQIDALVLLALNENADTIRNDTDRGIAIITESRRALAALADAQVQLGVAGRNPDDLAIEQANQQLTRFSELLEQLESAYEEGATHPWISSKH